MKEQESWLALSVCNGIGPTRLSALVDYFGSAEAAWDAPIADLKQSGIGNKISEDLASFRSTFSVEAYLERLHDERVWFMTQKDPQYPKRLQQIQKPPPILYGKGNSECLAEENTLLAVVGTRKITDYGRQVTSLLVTDLVGAGCVIVSGLAMGVDAVAHQATLAAGGLTIAVLGSGVDLCTPQENSSLYDQILSQGGLLLSETPLGIQPNKGSFPARNRIIAGLSQGVLVTEGAQDSGSLITANIATSEKRTVFAVPGPITSSVSKGPIALIATGAKMVTSATDILNELGVKNKTASSVRKVIKGDTPEENMILDVLQNENLSFDDIVRQTGFDSAKVGTLLSLMELKRMVRNLENSIFGLTE